MTDPDTVERLLLQAAGVRRPSSMDISSILSLIEEGYDLDLHILPGIRDGVIGGKTQDAVSSWRYFIPAIKKRRTKVAITPSNREASIDGDFADGERPVWWIRGSDPRFSSLAARWAAGKKQRRPAPITSSYFKGSGWAFPAHWVA